jgi:hypothetical protein
MLPNKSGNPMPHIFANILTALIIAAKFRFSVSTPSRFHGTQNLRGHYFFISLKKMKYYKNYGHRKFHVQLGIIEYETVYFTKAAKYDENQQKCI